MLLAAYRRIRQRLDDAEGVVGIYDELDDRAELFHDGADDFRGELGSADSVIAELGGGQGGAR